MTRSRTALVLAAALALVSTQAIRADVRSDEKTKVQLGGALGKMMNFFGGRSAREGVTQTVALKGNRLMTTNENTGELHSVAMARAKLSVPPRRKAMRRAWSKKLSDLSACTSSAGILARTANVSKSLPHEGRPAPTLHPAPRNSTN